MDGSPRVGAGQNFSGESVEVFPVKMDRNVVAGAAGRGVMVYVITMEVGHQDGVYVVPPVPCFRKRRGEPPLGL